MRDSNMSARQEARCSRCSQARAFQALRHSSERRKECGMRNPTEHRQSIELILASTPPPPDSPGSSVVERQPCITGEKAVGPGFNPRPGLQKTKQQEGRSIRGSTHRPLRRELESLNRFLPYV